METAFWREDGSSNLQFGMVRGDLLLGKTRTVKTKELGLVRATGFPPSYVTTKQPNTFRPFFSHLILQPKPLIHHSPSHVSNSKNAKQRKINNLGSIAILIKPCDQNIEESSSEIQSARILQHFEIWSPGIPWTFERKSCSEIWHVFIASMTYIWPE